MREKLSAFVISHNRAALLETCLRAAAFADELIVVDKSSTDGTVEVARAFATRVEVVPFSPTVEETRAYAASLCRHDWILCLDDDEILSPAAADWWRGTFDPAAGDIVAIPLRHYILGVHDERAYYWPEAHNRLFRRGAVEFLPTVHAGFALLSDRVIAVAPETGVCIHHLSHPDVASWIERANRYTSRPDRAGSGPEDASLVPFAHARLDFWIGRTIGGAGNDYPAAVAVLRAVYDIIDRLKTWEAVRGLDGAAEFRAAQARLVPTTDTARTRPDPVPEPDVPAGERDLIVRLRAAEAEARGRAALLTKAHAAHDATRLALTHANRAREAAEAARRDAEQQLASVAAERDQAWRAAADAVAAKDQLAGSARRFLRAYWPCLLAHLRGRIRRPRFTGFAAPARPTYARRE